MSLLISFNLSDLFIFNIISKTQENQHREDCMAKMFFHKDSFLALRIMFKGINKNVQNSLSDKGEGSKLRRIENSCCEISTKSTPSRSIRRFTDDFTRVANNNEFEMGRSAKTAPFWTRAWWARELFVM